MKNWAVVMLNCGPAVLFRYAERWRGPDPEAAGAAEEPG